MLWWVVGGAAGAHAYLVKTNKGMAAAAAAAAVEAAVAAEAEAAAPAGVNIVVPKSRGGVGGRRGGRFGLGGGSGGAPESKDGSGEGAAGSLLLPSGARGDRPRDEDVEAAAAAMLVSATPAEGKRTGRRAHARGT